jgi:hypothetical protein
MSIAAAVGVRCLSNCGISPACHCPLPHQHGSGDGSAAGAAGSAGAAGAAERHGTYDGTILFIDELHNMVGAGSSSAGRMDAANILKPALARGLQCVGATTTAEYRAHIEQDGALVRRFQVGRERGEGGGGGERKWESVCAASSGVRLGPLTLAPTLHSAAH